MNHASLFSGIGGFDLAAEWMGWQNVFNCEWEEFPRKVLKHHFPNAIQYGDIKQLDATSHLGRVDILTGGFPCQPYSLAGKRMGKEDERHLWPEMCRVIREVQPRWVVGENVRGIIGWNGGMVFDEVQADLEAEGYEVTPYVLPAAAVGAPHRRDRVWFVAHSDTDGFRLEHTKESGSVGQGKRQARDHTTKPAQTDGRVWDAADTFGRREQQDNRQGKPRQSDQTRTLPNWQTFPTVTAVCGRDDGLPKELDGITLSKWRRESIKAYGNAIVPQVALQIFKAIEQYEIHI